jgi:hypothetical protein
MKRCSACKRKLPIIEYPKDSSRKDGLSYKCRKCQNAVNKKSYFDHLQQRLAQYKHYDQTVKLYKKFSITPEEWDKLYSEQNGRCKICGKHQIEEGKRLAVDHNHLTGRIRGLLCTSCNTKLGWLENNLSQVTAYLNEDI